MPAGVKNQNEDLHVHYHPIPPQLVQLLTTNKPANKSFQGKTAPVNPV